MGKAIVKLNRAGVKELLGSHGVRAALTSYARRTASAAGPDTFIVDDTSGGYRAVVQVHTVGDRALANEAKSGRLVRALDAATGGGAKDILHTSQEGNTRRVSGAQFRHYKRGAS